MRKLILSILFILVIIFIVLVSFKIDIDKDKEKLTFYKCIDGDTAWFYLNSEKVKVRFLGVNTPEVSGDFREEYGDIARDYTCKILTSSSDIYLEYDDNSDSKDKYGRVLGWIFVDNKNLSELLVSKGYALVKYVYDDYKYVDELCIAQDKAYSNKLGIWDIYNDDIYQDNYCLLRK